MFSRILVAVDGSAHANRAVECAANLANKYGAELILLHVMASLGSARIPPDLDELARIEHIDATEADVRRRVAEEILQAAEKLALGQGAKQVRILIGVGHAAEMIVEHAKEEAANLIVMGRRGLGSASGLLVGSVSHKVAHLSQCPCMTVI
jgi:nucleotide-binding universal stress UspA family protein